jgi:CDP-diacylglycerol---serine O-phosphatidyltransferase
VAGFIWLMTERAAGEGGDLVWPMFAITLYAGLTMVTNVPFYSFKDLSLKKSVPFAAIVLVALGHCGHQHPPAHRAVRPVRLYGLSGYAVYFWRKAKGRPDQRDQHLHRRARRARPARLIGLWPMVFARHPLCYISP